MFKKQLAMVSRDLAHDLSMSPEDVVECKFIKSLNNNSNVFYLEFKDGTNKFQTLLKQDLSFISNVKNAVVSKRELESIPTNDLVAGVVNKLYGFSMTRLDVEYSIENGDSLQVVVSRNSMRFQGDFQIKIIE